MPETEIESGLQQHRYTVIALKYRTIPLDSKETIVHRHLDEVR